MQNDYYENILYPIQDKVLRVISEFGSDLYLTGGTALSRIHLKHRYSDDLDFFVNNGKSFTNDINMIIDLLRQNQISFDIGINSPGFIRIFVSDNKNVLKIDFVNDIQYRVGETIGWEKFPRVDNILNILSNKITALTRYETKDIIDIVYIALKAEFFWEDVFRDAVKKDIWANPIEAAKVIDSFPPDKIKEIIWIGNPPSVENFTRLISQLIKDILSNKRNMLYHS